MPKRNNLIKEQRRALYDRITPTHLFSLTGIFSDPIGDKPLDQYTVNKIKNSYRLYFESWVKEAAKKFILQEKTQGHDCNAHL